MSADQYSRPVYPGRSIVTAAIAEDDVGRLPELVIALVLNEEDRAFAQETCLSLCTHHDEIVRGNAVLGFGHIARIHCVVDAIAVDAVRANLDDVSRYVRGHAQSALEDIELFAR